MDVRPILFFDSGVGGLSIVGPARAALPDAPFVYAVVWLGLLGTVRISSVAGIAAALSTPFAAALFNRFDLVLLLLSLALIVLWKHRENVERLFAGTEPRIGGGNRQRGG